VARGVVKHVIENMLNGAWRDYKKKMPVVIKKCKFFTRKTNFIRFIIKLGKISMDLKKVEAIVSWQKLENII